MKLGVTYNAKKTYLSIFYIRQSAQSFVLFILSVIAWMVKNYVVLIYTSAKWNMTGVLIVRYSTIVISYPTLSTRSNSWNVWKSTDRAM